VNDHPDEHEHDNQFGDHENTARVQTNTMGEPVRVGPAEPETVGNQHGTNIEPSTVDEHGDPVFAADYKHEAPGTGDPEHDHTVVDQADANHEEAPDGNKPNLPMQDPVGYDAKVKQAGGPTFTDPAAVRASGVDTSAAGDPLVVNSARSISDSLVTELHRHLQAVQAVTHELHRINGANQSHMDSVNSTLETLKDHVRAFFTKS
jgi:hypothetical protein